MITPETIRAAALATPGVHGMHPGPHGTAAAFSTTGRIWGVRVTDPRIDVHVVADHGHALNELGRAIHRSVSAVVGDYAGDIVIHIEDIASSADQSTEATDISRAGARDESLTRRTS